MSRSYHVTEKEATAAFYEGDLEPGYQGSEKSWIKRAVSRMRKGSLQIPNRAAVGEEKARTKRVETKRLADDGRVSEKMFSKTGDAERGEGGKTTPVTS